MKTLELGSRSISADSLPYVIAEIGVNHEGSMETARRLIELAKEGGADGAKFQTYKAESLASRESPSYWDTSKEPTTSQYELFKKYDSFGADEYRSLAQHCRSVGIDFLSTPFDDDAIDFLNPLVPFFKVASGDLTNTPFLRRVARTRKVVVLSTGGSTLAEIDAAVRTLDENGAYDIVLLHCVLNYPTSNSDAHLRMISGLRRVFPGRLVGYSDHTLPGSAMTPLMVAYLQGATVLEKHFTHDKSLPGNDHYHAMDVEDLTRFVGLARRTHELLGAAADKGPIESEGISRLNARRSLVALHDIRSGTEVSSDDLTYKRPGTGISPTHWDEVLGLTTLRDISADSVLRWKDFEGPT